MTKQVYTMNDVESCREWFSDAYKDVHGIRPRGWSDEAMIHWLNTTDIQAELDEQAELEAAWLAKLGFESMTEYYAHQDAILEAKFNGLRAPKTPGERQQIADTTLTSLEELDPRLCPNKNFVGALRRALANRPEIA